MEACDDQTAGMQTTLVGMLPFDRKRTNLRVLQKNKTSPKKVCRKVREKLSVSVGKTEQTFNGIRKSPG